MNRISVGSCLLLLATVMLSGCEPDGPPTNTMTYRGQTIHLTKFYSDYDDYKDDPNNIDPKELPRVQKLMLGATLQKSFPDRLAVGKAVFSVAFPGYGVASYAETPQADGSALWLMSVEIPPRDRERYFVFRKRSGTYTLADNFVRPQTGPPIQSARDQSGKIVYLDASGNIVVTR